MSHFLLVLGVYDVLLFSEQLLIVFVKSNLWDSRRIFLLTALVLIAQPSFRKPPPHSKQLLLHFLHFNFVVLIPKF